MWALIESMLSTTGVVILAILMFYQIVHCARYYVSENVFLMLSLILCAHQEFFLYPRVVIANLSIAVVATLSVILTSVYTAKV